MARGHRLRAGRAQRPWGARGRPRRSLQLLQAPTARSGPRGGRLAGRPTRWLGAPGSLWRARLLTETRTSSRAGLPPRVRLRGRLRSPAWEGRQAVGKAGAAALCQAAAAVVASPAARRAVQGPAQGASSCTAATRLRRPAGASSSGSEWAMGGEGRGGRGRCTTRAEGGHTQPASNHCAPVAVARSTQRRQRHQGTGWRCIPRLPPRRRSIHQPPLPRLRRRPPPSHRPSRQWTRARRAVEGTCPAQQLGKYVGLRLVRFKHAT